MLRNRKPHIPGDSPENGNVPASVEGENANTRNERHEPLPTTSASEVSWASYALVSFLCGACYANSIPNEFTYDDNFAIVQNADVRCSSALLYCRAPNSYSTISHCKRSSMRKVTRWCAVRGETTVRDVFTHDFWGRDIMSPLSHKSYRPLTILSFRCAKCRPCRVLAIFNFS